MKVLIDTNILLRIAQLTSSDRPTAKSAIVSLVNADYQLCIVPQVIYEFWVVASRPVSANGLGMDPASTERSVNQILNDFDLLKDERGIFAIWQSLVRSRNVSGKTAHDARLVAAMQRHGIDAILTFNNSDFTRFSDIQVLTPLEVVNGRLPS